MRTKEDLLKIFEKYKAKEDGFINVNDILNPFFQEAGKKWNPEIKCRNDEEKRQLRCYIHKVKLRFSCDCSNDWTSAKSLMFISVIRKRGVKYFDIFVFDQKCNKCETWSGDCHIYEEDFKNILEIAIALVQGYEVKEKERRDSKTRRPHDKGRCKACQVGVCGMKWFFG